MFVNATTQTSLINAGTIINDVAKTVVWLFLLNINGRLCLRTFWNPSERVKGRTRTEIIANNKPKTRHTDVLKMFSTDVKGYCLNLSFHHKNTSKDLT